MGGIKYYQLAKGEELPDEFCAVRDINGEPSEYTFYVPEAENAKLRELCERCAIELYANGNVADAATENLFDDMRELGIEVDKCMGRQ